MKNQYKIINKVLILFILFLFGYLIWDIVNTKPYVFKSPPVVSGLIDTTPPPENKTGLKDFQIYLDTVSKRNIFLPYRTEPVKKVVEEKPPEPKIPITTFTANLKVVGFSLGNPIMVMIEDSKNARTHFLKEGDIINELTIQKILDDSVVLTDGKEEVTLK